jgi:hypothetical protein
MSFRNTTLVILFGGVGAMAIPEKIPALAERPRTTINFSGNYS